MATVTASLQAEKLQAYRAARQKGVQWLLRHLNPDGSLGDPRGAAEAVHTQADGRRAELDRAPVRDVDQTNATR